MGGQRSPRGRSSCIGDGWSVQANVLASAEVLPAMSQAIAAAPSRGVTSRQPPDPLQGMRARSGWRAWLASMAGDNRGAAVSRPLD